MSRPRTQTVARLETELDELLARLEAPSDLRKFSLGYFLEQDADGRLVPSHSQVGQRDVPVAETRASEVRELELLMARLDEEERSIREEARLVRRTYAKAMRRGYVAKAEKGEKPLLPLSAVHDDDDGGVGADQSAVRQDGDDDREAAPTLNGIEAQQRRLEEAGRQVGVLKERAQVARTSRRGAQRDGQRDRALPQLAVGQQGEKSGGVSDADERAEKYVAKREECLVPHGRHRRQDQRDEAAVGISPALSDAPPLSPVVPPSSPGPSARPVAMLSSCPLSSSPQQPRQPSPGVSPYAPSSFSSSMAPMFTNQSGSPSPHTPIIPTIQHVFHSAPSPSLTTVTSAPPPAIIDLSRGTTQVDDDLNSMMADMLRSIKASNPHTDLKTLSTATVPATARAPPIPEVKKPAADVRACGRCHKMVDEYGDVVQAMNHRWHPSCFTCYSCGYRQSHWKFSALRG